MTQIHCNFYNFLMWNQSIQNEKKAKPVSKLHSYLKKCSQSSISLIQKIHI